MINPKKFCTCSAPTRRGFSLVEVLISVLLTAVIAGAVSMALYQSHQRRDQTHINLIRLQRGNNTMQTLAEELRWAREILQFEEQKINFSAPDPDNIGAYLEILYEWDENGSALYRSVEGDVAVMAAANVNIFSLQADVVQEELGAETYSYLRGVTVTLQIGDNAGDSLQRYIECYNRPVYQPE